MAIMVAKGYNLAYKQKSDKLSIGKFKYILLKILDVYVQDNFVNC